MVEGDTHAVSQTGAPPSAWSPPSGSARRYTILRRLAVGGMGELLLARASSAHGVAKLVAIKRVRCEYASDPSFVSMFLNEARLAATLDHPNVVRTYDLVEDAGNYFMVMEYLHGEPLGQLLNVASRSKTPIPLSHVVTVVLGVAAGLHCAHERRGVDGRPLDIVHRDLSPGNVFLTYEGGVKLLDFGIAKATSRTSITFGPARKGKVSYMSPEQCVGSDVDRRSDIFALGIVMWELCTAQRLFRGDNEFSIMNQITTIDAPSPREHVPDLPQALCDVIARALRRDREDRFQTAMELHDAVEAFAGGAGILPSGPALGRYVEAQCGRREFPSVEPSPEYTQAKATTLVVPGSVPTPSTSPGPRRWSLVLALAAGAAAGAVAVGAASSDSKAPAPTQPPATAAPAAVAASAPADEATPDPAPIHPTPPTPQTPQPVAEPPAAVAAPAQARLADEVPDEPPSSDSSPSKRKRKRTRTRPAPADSKPSPSTDDKTVRGVDGLLPRG